MVDTAAACGGGDLRKVEGIVFRSERCICEATKSCDAKTAWGIDCASGLQSRGAGAYSQAPQHQAYGLKYDYRLSRSARLKLDIEKSSQRHLKEEYMLSDERTRQRFR